MRYDYDMLGTRIHQPSMEAGERWMLNDVTGKPIRVWNSRLYDFRTEYDPLRRPLRSFVVGGDSGKQNESESETFTQEILFQRTIYGEQVPTPEATNLRGRVFMQLDSAGAVTSGGQNGHTPEAYDFRGNLLRGSRRLATMASGTNKATVDWKSVDQALPVGTMTLAELTGVETAVGLLVESDTFETSGTFDALNRPLTATAPDGSVSRPTYNEAGLLETLGVNIRGAAAPTLFVQGIDYDAKGRRTRIESGQKSGGGAVATTEYTYDPETVRLRRLVTTRVSPPSDFASQVFQSARTLQDLSYTYDPVGNITQIADAALLTTFNNNLQVDPTCLYVYDAIYRLVEATGRELIGQAGLETSGLAASLRDFPFSGLNVSQNDLQAVRPYTERYTYDGVGNIKEMQHAIANGGWTRGYTYAEDSLIEKGTPQGAGAKQSNCLSSTTVSSNSQETYGYDAHGNMQMPHLAAMGWDFRDQLRVSQRRVVNNGVGDRTYYVYDGSGQRTRKVTERSDGSRKNERVYLGGYEVYREYDRSGTLTLDRQTLHKADGARRLALVETKTFDASVGGGNAESLIRYQFDNHIGSATVELDGEGAAIWYEEYLPYGESTFQVLGTSSVEVSAKRYRYTGMETDLETGLRYHSARYCASWLARWTTVDPEWFVNGTNVYAYTNNSPICLKDPSGTSGENDYGGTLPDGGLPAPGSDSGLPPPDIPASPPQTSASRHSGTTSAAPISPVPVTPPTPAIALPASALAPVVAPQPNATSTSAETTPSTLPPVKWENLRVRLGVGVALSIFVGARGFVGIEFNPTHADGTLRLLDGNPHLVGEIGASQGLGGGANLGNVSFDGPVPAGISKGIRAGLNLGPLQLRFPASGQPSLRANVTLGTKAAAGVDEVLTARMDISEVSTISATEGHKAEEAALRLGASSQTAYHIGMAQTVLSIIAGDALLRAIGSQIVGWFK